MCSCGGNQLIDHINEVGGNQVKIRQKSALEHGNVDNFIKKNSLLMSNAFVFYLRGKTLEISCACVCFF